MRHRHPEATNKRRIARYQGELARKHEERAASTTTSGRVGRYYWTDDEIVVLIEKDALFSPAVFRLSMTPSQSLYTPTVTNRFQQKGVELEKKAMKQVSQVLRAGSLSSR